MLKLMNHSGQNLFTSTPYISYYSYTKHLLFHQVDDLYETTMKNIKYQVNIYQDILPW